MIESEEQYPKPIQIVITILLKTKDRIWHFL